MPYHIGEKGSYGCSGYPAIKDGTNEVMGCHTTRAEAAAQIYAINISEGNTDKAMQPIKEGDFVMGMTSEGMVHGVVEHIMNEGGTLGTPGSEYALTSMPPENPAMSVRVYKEDDGKWEPTAYSIGMMYKDAQVADINNHSMEDDDDDEMDSEVMMAMYDAQVGKSQMANAPYEDAEEMDKEYQGCGCPTCKELNVDCPNCPVCQADMNKAKKPNYGEMIQPRSGGSTPSNPRLYARVVQEAKDKFDVYPSAVANGWVVQEYKRRGGTYKMDDMDKRDYSTAARERMAATGAAMPDGSFPIANGGDLQNAIQSVGRAANYAAAKEHIIRRARALGMMEMLPEDWRNNATKGMGNWSGSIFDLNPFVK
jgi:hypothetical protein